MKHFTLQWWKGEAKLPDDDAYSNYIESVRDLLPATVLSFFDTVSLHDSRLRKLYVDLAKQTISVDLEGYQYAKDSKEFLPINISLAYTGVQSFMSTGPDEDALPGPHGYGDLGYDEFEVLNHGVIEHRWLFSTGIEIAIRFLDMAFNCSEREEPDDEEI